MSWLAASERNSLGCMIVGFFAFLQKSGGYKGFLTASFSGTPGGSPSTSCGQDSWEWPTVSTIILLGVGTVDNDSITVQVRLASYPWPCWTLAKAANGCHCSYVVCEARFANFCRTQTYALHYRLSPRRVQLQALCRQRLLTAQRASQTCPLELPPTTRPSTS
jgi:hypothetical protein